MVATVVVGACTFPDYTFEGPPFGAGGSGGVGVTADASTTGLSGMMSTGTATSGGSETSSSTTGAATADSGGSGGSGGDNIGGSAGAGADAGAEVGGAGGTGGGAGATTGGGSGNPGGNGGDAGSGGTGGGTGQCGNDTQCASGQCDGGWCRAPHCGNGVADELETDTDCGGPDCRPCGYDQHCVVDADCASLDCSSSERCEPPLVVNCHCNSAGACNQTPQTTVVDIQLWNPGNAPLALSGLQFRYFYSGAESGRDQVRCDQVNFTNGGCAVFAAEVLTTEYGDPMASHEVAFEFSGGTLSANQTTGPIRFSIYGNGPYQRGDDYSFQGAPTSNSQMPAACENIVVLNADGVPLWGFLPE